ncbi:MAG: transcription antitermination factor NusB [Planctomycetota bacterium]
MAVRKRTRARELALQFLYSIDLREDGPSLEVDPFLRMQTRDDEIYLFATGLVNGCLAHREEIDREIRRVAEHWDLARIATVDRNILRIGAHEILHRMDIPPQVTLNEAVELAKLFSTKKSGAFVNGILDRLRADAGRAADHTGPLAARPGEEPACEPEGETTEQSLDDESENPPEGNP